MSGTLVKLQAAVRLLQSGRADDAKTQLAEIIAAEPANADALALMGLVHAQQGDNGTAAALMERAIVLNPRHPATLFNYANVLGKLGRVREAIDAYARVLALKPDHDGARRARGHALADAGRDDEALGELDRVQGANGDTLALRARLRFSANKFADAIADYDLVLKGEPANFAAWNNRGIALDKLDRYEDALASYERALALQPDHDDALHNKGAALLCLQRYDEALPLFERLIATDPMRADNWSCRGAALASLLRMDEAVASFEKALALDAQSLRALNGLGMALVALGRVAEGIEHYRQALALHPDNAMTRGNLAFAQLVSGDFADGFANYEWRRKEGPIGKAQRAFAQDEWKGEDVSGKTVLLHPEQGLGDVVQFARFASLLADQGARVILEVPAPLKRLMRTMDGVTVVRSGAPLPPFDLHAPLMSLAHRLGTTLETIPARVPYICADEDERAHWRARLSALPPGPRVGLCWAGHHIHRSDHARSIPLAQFAEIARSDGFAFVSLQREVREGDGPVLRSLPHVADWMSDVTDFAATAALIAELDLVVTVDTSVAHVAGALGKPVWILIAAAPDWRWLLGRDDSPWYPTARLFRHERLGAWSGALAAVTRALYQFNA